MSWLPRLVVACLLGLVPGLADAAVLIEAKAGEQAIRMVIGLEAERVLVERTGREPVLVDFAKGVAFFGEGEAATPRHLRFRPGHEPPPPYRLEDFGPGPVIASHGSVYQVLFVENAVCAEVLISPWMRPFVDPAVRALALIEQVEHGVAQGEEEACERIPMTTLAAAGWPLMVGTIDQPKLVTETIRFDYLPAADELRLPASAAESAPPAAGGPG